MIAPLKAIGVVLLLAAPLIAACGGDDDAGQLSEEEIRRIVREESQASAEEIRRISREEIARALAARDANGACDAGTAADRALPSVVRLEVHVPGTAIVTSNGTGFVALAGGIILTAAHVVGDAPRVDVTTADGRRLTGDVIRRDATLDLAVLRVPDRTLPAVKWADPSAVVLGEPVRVVGFPANVGLTVTGGVLASRTPASGNEPEILVTDASVDAGNSGGPLLTSCGEALGVIVRREPLIYTVSTVSVGAGTALPFVLSAVNTPTTPTPSATATPGVAPTPAASPSPSPPATPVPTPTATAPAAPPPAPTATRTQVP